MPLPTTKSMTSKKVSDSSSWKHTQPRPTRPWPAWSAGVSVLFLGAMVGCSAPDRQRDATPPTTTLSDQELNDAERIIENANATQAAAQRAKAAQQAAQAAAYQAASDAALRTRGAEPQV